MALLPSGNQTKAGHGGPSASRMMRPARLLSDDNPVAAEGRAPSTKVTRAAAANDMYGFCSIEDFPPGIGDLGATHEDAQGFYDYVRQFITPNFWLRDGSVLSWAYGETYDNWQDFYGFDACTVVYHSGHGNMRADGIFEMPMGGTWGGSQWVTSQDMRLGNELARYIFLSTCLSLRVHDGQSPIRTWDASNLGFRMLFGFETVSIDSPDYGKFFFEEWNKNKSFSQAWLDASWRISTTQAPSVVACGATQAEAQDRLFNERFFSRSSAAKTWWWWRWYDAARRAAPQELTLPQSVRGLRFAPADVSAKRLTDLAEHYGISITDVPDIERASRGLMVGTDQDGPRLSIDSHGNVEVRFADPDGGGRDAPRADEAVGIASTAVESFGLADNVDLVAHDVRHEYSAGGSGDQLSQPRVRETTVVFTQSVDGLGVVTPGVGEVRVGIDGAGTVTRIIDATRPVDDVRDRPATFAAPSEDLTDSKRAGTASTVDEVLEEPLQRVLRRLSAGGHVPARVQTVPDSTEVGYAVRGADGIPVARRTVEVDCGQNLRKRFVIETPLHG